MAVIDSGRHQHLVGDLLIQQRLAGTEDERKPLLGIKPLRLVSSQLLGELDPLRVYVGDRHRPTITVLVEQVHRAPISDLGHRKLSDISQRLLVIKRGGQRVADLGEEGAISFARFSSVTSSMIMIVASTSPASSSSGAAFNRCHRCVPLVR